MHRYVVQFCAKGYFTTDCGFREGQLARRYVRSVVDTLEEVTEGIVVRGRPGKADHRGIR